MWNKPNFESELALCEQSLGDDQNDGGKTTLISSCCFDFPMSMWARKSYIIGRVRNQGAKVREFAIVFPFSLSCLGRAEEQNQPIFTDPNIPIFDSGKVTPIYLTSD